MARLLVNVAVDGIWFGPAYGNSEAVPAAVAARLDPALFDGVPVAEVASPSVDDEPGNGGAAPVVSPSPAVVHDPRSLQDLTVDQLRAVALDANVDLGSARRKADIIAVLAPALDEA